MLKLLTALTLLAVLTSTSCSKKAVEESIVDPASNNIQSALGVVSAASSDTEDATIGMSMAGFLKPLSVHPDATCDFSSVRSACDGSGVSTIDWNSCSIGTTTMTGGWTNLYDTNGHCVTSQSAALPAGATLDRTSTGSVATFSDFATLTTDTTAHTAYDGTVIPGTGIHVLGTGGVADRTITINGLHRVLRGPRGRSWFDHSITGSLTVTGTKAGGDRVVTGTVTIYHNLASYVADNSFNSVRWSNAACCYPTSGNITTSISGGGINWGLTMTFNSTCGQVTYVNERGIASLLTLNYCE